MSKLIRRKFNSKINVKPLEHKNANLIFLPTPFSKKKSKDKIQVDPERMIALRKWRDEELKDYKVQLPDPAKKNPSYLEIAEALIKNDGFIMKTALSLGISYYRINKLIKLNPRLREIVVNATEALLDLAESRLKDGILAGDKTCIIFTLKCRGRMRGWIEENTVLDTMEQKPITFQYNLILPEGCRLVTGDNVTIFDNRKMNEQAEEKKI